MVRGRNGWAASSAANWVCKIYSNANPYSTPYYSMDVWLIRTALIAKPSSELCGSNGIMDILLIVM